MSKNKSIIIACIVGVFVVGAVFLLAFYSMPDSPLFLLKRWEEKTLFNMQVTPSSKISYDLFLLNRRREEMDDITAKKEYDLFYPCSLRYSSLAGEITGESLQNRLQKQQILQTFSNDQKTIATLYARNDGHEEWKYIHDAINYLSIYKNQLTQPH